MTESERAQADARWPVAVRFGGLGGQGLVTLGAVLAQAGAEAGLRVAASQSYGSRARGGATRADVILSAAEIDFPHVHHPDLLLVLAQEAYELYAPAVAAGGAVLADSFFVRQQEPPAGVRLLRLDATGTALSEVGNKVAANFVMLGALLGYTGLLEAAAVETAIAELVRPRFQALNRQALAEGLARGRALAAGGQPWR